MFFDYHTHSQYSFDGERPAADMEEICFTDHVDFDVPGRSHVPDFASRRGELEALGRRYSSVTIRHGAEVSLGDEACAAAAWTAVRDAELDFIIGSVHVVDGVDVWSDGKALEINTASWQEDAPWGMDVLRRYRELGGEYVTVGSDTHGVERVGARVREAMELARAAGIRYVATFQRGEPRMHRL